MNNTENIITELWDYMDEYKDKNKIHQKVYYWLNCDNLSGILIDNNVFYFELTTSYTTMPNYIYTWLKKWTQQKHKNLTYLYDIDCKN